MSHHDFHVSKGLSINHSSHDYAAPDEPPPPMISSEGVVAIDITRKFVEAAKTLEPGELVKDGYFTLFESVGALEIMDPKMDSGCLAPGESLDDDYDVARPLLPSEVMGIIDQLLCLEMAWHLGYPLSQTLLTNVYIEAILNPAPGNLQEAHFIRDPESEAAQDSMFTVLRAYCLGLLKSCWYVNERIKFEHYYEEEDFVTNTYHRSLLDNIDRDEIRDEIMSARRLVHSLRPKIMDDVADALSFRLELRAAFLRAIELSELRSSPESLSLPWSQMKAVWEPINKSRHLGTPVPEAFSTKLQRRLASTMPPRPIVQLSFEETYEHFKKLFVDAIDVLKVLNYVDSQSLLNFVLTFQAQKPQPLVYIRTLLQNFLFKDMVILGHLSIRHVIDDDLSIVVLPCSRHLDPANDDVEVPHDARFAIAHQMELFRQRAAQSYLDIFRAFCQNRCRVRRTLCHSIQDWETVQLDAEEIDQLLQVQLDEQPICYSTTLSPPDPNPTYSLPLSSWAYLYKLRLMEWIVQLGFELETYQPDELPGMYWYLSFLAKTRAQHAERIKGFASYRYNELRFHGALTPALEAQFNRSASYLRLTILDAAVTWELSDALTRLYVALARLRCITPPPRPYSSDELRYDIRMKPFSLIQLPELPSYEAFRRETEQADKSTAELLDAAQRSVGGARRGYERLSKMTEKEVFTVGAHERWVKGTKSCLRSVIAASIAIATVGKIVGEGDGGDAGGRLVVEVPRAEACYHDWWIVPKVTERK
ncbi:Mak10 subunit, NatC N-terminal acetyltransferase-domain-containing protein [Cercophora newfieldiana]|uniref:Mak10 subunit, NatC N-terminal acetyltransferase-domain-containing protein n=1 Tax=Cercophora newfieldiana TaxID=92897 RepID=A0AA39YFN1_9PEZI|nr:Mak10 subunit, NatC N-terminal acetyltransferase-domain-containing protein [Cercophora newfieldiana]